MVEKFNGFKSKQGGLFLSEEAAVRSEVLDNLCEIIPEFQLIRPRLEANLNAIASAVGPMVAFRARVPSKPPISEDCLCSDEQFVENRPAKDCPVHGSPDEDCTCGVSMKTPRHHRRDCPIYERYRLKPATFQPSDKPMLDVCQPPRGPFGLCRETVVAMTEGRPLPVAGATEHA